MGQTLTQRHVESSRNARRIKRKSQPLLLSAASLERHSTTSIKSQIHLPLTLCMPIALHATRRRVHMYSMYLITCIETTTKPSPLTAFRTVKARECSPAHKRVVCSGCRPNPYPSPSVENQYQKSVIFAGVTNTVSLPRNGTCSVSSDAHALQLSQTKLRQQQPEFASGPGFF